MSGSNRHGTDAEDAVREVAAAVGLPDFVFTVPRLDKGAASREVGDALLIANGIGAVVQVKARRPDAADDGSRWLAKHGAKAARQAARTRRSIKLAQDRGRPLLAVPVRTAGLDPKIQAQAALALTADASDWPSVVVVDHPAATGLEPPDSTCFWITLGDWHELWAALRTVTGMLVYVRRALDAGQSVPLGEESSRFTALRDADVSDHGQNAWLTTGTYDDPLGAQLYRELVDRVWPNDRPLPSVSMADYRLIVDFLDHAAPGVLPRAGRWVLRKREEQTRHGRSGGLLLLDHERLLVYKAGTWTGPESEARFDAELVVTAVVRSAEASQQLGRFVPALGVGNLVGPGHIDYRYVYTREPAEPTPLERALVVHETGAFNVDKQALVPIPDAAPGDLCPCGSGATAEACPQALVG